jgi:hypothetical protein
MDPVIDYSADVSDDWKHEVVAKGIGKRFVAVYKDGRNYLAQFVDTYQECRDASDGAWRCIHWCSGKVSYTPQEMREAGYKHRKGNAEVLLG